LQRYWNYKIRLCGDDSGKILNVRKWISKYYYLINVFLDSVKLFTLWDVVKLYKAVVVGLGDVVVVVGNVVELLEGVVVFADNTVDNLTSFVLR